MDEEKSSEENTESKDKSEIHEENSVDNEVKEESTESQNDSEDKEEINEEKTEDSEVKKEGAADAEDKEIINEEKTEDSQIKEESVNEPVSQDNELNNSEPQGEANVSEPVSENNKVENPEQSEAKVEEKVSEPAPKGVPSDEGKEKPLNKKGKEGSFMPIFFVMIISLVIAFAWDKVPVIQNSVHSILDPTAGSLLTWNLTAGMLLIVLIITLVTTIIQKYATDQEALKELKKEQKILQEEMKKYKDHPEKVAELSKKQFQFIPKTFKLTSRAIMFTGVPFILFFRWFSDVFITMEATTGAPVKFLGFLSWFWFYLIFTMVFSSILRKTFKVV